MPTYTCTVLSNRLSPEQKSRVMFRALQNVAPSHLADTKLFDFQGLQPQDAPCDDVDLVFDHD